MRADLSLQQSPPFSVPAIFLVSAPIFSLLAALLLLGYGPEIISHRWTPEILAITHFLTLGFIAMSMVGAMMQLMPVLMGMLIPHAIIFSRIIHGSLTLGSLSLGLAWLLHIKTLFIIASVLLGFTFLVFISVTIERLLRSANRHATRGLMILALIALLITASIGIYLSLGYGLQSLPLARHLTNIHLSWGLLGWVFLLIMGAAYQVIPMFQITDEYPAAVQRWMPPIAFISLIGLSISTLWTLDVIKLILSLSLAGCVLLFALTTLQLLHKRRRKIPDTTMKFWQLSMSSLIIAALLWLTSTIFNIELPVFLLAVLIIHGFAMTAINGMMYKIIPFIIWLHLSVHNKNLRDAGKRDIQLKVPHMRKIIAESATLWQFRCHMTSLVLLAVASILPQWFYYPGVLFFAAAQSLLLLNLVKAAQFYKIKTIEFSKTI